MSPRLLAGGACALFLLTGALPAANPLQSGPQVGSPNDRSGFFPRWVTGPCAGKRLCPVWSRYDLVALAFVRDTSDPLTSLVKKIDRRMQAAVGKTTRPLGAYFLFMNDGGDLDGRLRGLAEKEAIQQVALGVGAPPSDYGVAGEADLTVMVYRPGRRGQQQVVANFALRKGELDDAKADDIVKAITAVLPPHVYAVVPTSLEKEQTWRYTFAQPADGWVRGDFNDLSWKSGPGGFGSAGTPGAVVRTEWNTGAIWLRREIILPQGPFTHLHLRLHHDEDTEVYLNGVLAARLTGYTTGYREAPISEEARKTLRPGANVLAVSCRQTGGGQYIDVGLGDPKP